jgi:hypothetical protein
MSAATFNLSLDLEFDCDIHKRWKSIGKIAFEKGEQGVSLNRKLFKCGKPGQLSLEDADRLIDLYKYHYSIQDFNWNPEVVVRIEEEVSLITVVIC